MNNEIALKETIDTLEKLVGEMYLFSQPRSNYVLDHFVVCAYDTPARQREQIITELRSIYFGLCDVYSNNQLAKLNLEEITDDSHRSNIKKSKLEKRILANDIHIAGKLAECKHLLELLSRMPEYTREEYDKEEPEFWKRRLSRQSILTRSGDYGNLDAIIQMFSVPGQNKPFNNTDYIDTLETKLIKDGKL